MNPEVQVAILQMLRDARALVYRDAESFDQAAAVLEHIGQMLSGTVGNGLRAYEGAILGLAGQVPGTNARDLQALFHTVREARNDSVHSGDYIRHHVLRLVELFLILEEALSMNGRVVGDLMVRNPITAEQWHNVAAVRRVMLTNSFSYLPVREPEGAWMLLSDALLVGYLGEAIGNERRRRLGRTICDVVAEGAIRPLVCEAVSPDRPLDTVRGSVGPQPVLVVDGENNLLGILTAFDLL